MNWTLAFILAHGLDAATTQVGLSRGFREGVLPTQRADAIWAIEMSAATAESLAFKKWQRSHPKVMRALAVAVIAGESGAVAWNVHQLVTKRR